MTKRSRRTHSAAFKAKVARAALFLLSDEASFVNGTQLYVDNGFSAI